MKIVSDDSRFLRELLKEIQKKGVDAKLIELPNDDNSFASLTEINLPNIKMEGKWDLSFTKIINNFINKFYNNKDKQREHEITMMKLVIIRESAKKEIIDIDAIEKKLIAPPQKGDVLSIETIEKDS